MNCLELRHCKLVAPGALNAEAEQHLRTCPACAALVERLGAFEERLQSELRVPVPDGLADRVLFDVQQREATHPRRWRLAAERVCALTGGITRRAVDLTGASWGWRTRLAVAATLVLGLGIASFHALTLQEQSLALAVIAHVVHEEPVEMVAQPVADPPARVLAASGVHLPGDFREVRYLGRCGPPNRTGEHIVMQTPFGKASLVLTPGETAGFRVVQFDDGNAAVVAPARVGSLTVVAASKQAALQIADELR